MRKYIPALITGFSAAVLSIVPVIKSFSCCLIIPVAAIFALFLDSRVNRSFEKIQIGKAVLFGFITGLYATIFITLFDSLITFTARTNDLIEALPQTEKLIFDMNIGPMAEESLKILRQMAKDIRQNGFSGLYIFILFSSNFITNSIFGIIGGLVGMGLLNKRSREQ